MRFLDQKWIVLAGVSITSFLGCIDFTIVNTALPAIQGSLQGDTAGLQWVMNAFILALSTFMVIMGRLADIYGRRKVLYMGMLAFGLASLGAGLSNTLLALIVFRFIQGIACAVLYTATAAIVSHAFPLEERGKAIGTLFGVNGLGLAVGPVLGGFIVGALSWRWVFLINVPVIIFSLGICLMCVKESRNLEESSKIDWLGLFLLIVALPCLVLGITQGNAWGWDSPKIIGLFVTAVVTLGLFYKVETRSESPIIQFHFFANRTFIASIIGAFCLAFFYCLAFFLMPLYLSDIRGETPYGVGVMLLAVTVMVAIFSPYIGRVVDRYGSKNLMMLGFGLFIVSAVLQANFEMHASLIHVLLSFVAMGIGWACILGPSTVASISSVPDTVVAVAMGTSWTFLNIGGAVGLGLGEFLYQTQAQKAFVSGLFGAHVSLSTDQMTQALASPIKAVEILQHNTQLGLNESISVAHQSFIMGYQSAMWLLAGSSFAAMIIIGFLMKKTPDTSPRLKCD